MALQYNWLSVFFTVLVLYLLGFTDSHKILPPYTWIPDCKISESPCWNGQCIPKDKVCDQVYDCDDASDEMRCRPLGCEPNEFQCDNKRCVLKIWMCDADDDCGDGSDERGCVTNSPGSRCCHDEFACKNVEQCIPKAFHCDGEADCQDGSDENLCSKPVIIVPPPRNLMIQGSSTFSINCTAIGNPEPSVIWRLNWGHVPDKCQVTSVGGVGVLTCPRAEPGDQGIYSCEAINSKGSVFARPECFVQVNGGSPVCKSPYFNVLAQKQDECLKCFCFGITNECYSTDRYITQLPPPKSYEFELMGVSHDSFADNYMVHNKDYKIPKGYIWQGFGNDVQLELDHSSINASRDFLVYFSLPVSHKGQQLSSYGGYLRYKIKLSSTKAVQPLSGPEVIIAGNNMTLMHVLEDNFIPGEENQVNVRFAPGSWFKKVTGSLPKAQAQQPASREDIMIALENMELLLIRATYYEDSVIQTTLSQVQLDTTVIGSSDLGRATYVEECHCPPGYVGLSCQDCAPNYKRVLEGAWLGICFPNAECKPGEFGDPLSGIPCQACPCPFSTCKNQFCSTCYLDIDGQVTCNCVQGYAGRQCERCDEGYEGNPTIPGESCQPVGTAGSANGEAASQYTISLAENFFLQGVLPLVGIFLLREH